VSVDTSYIFTKRGRTVDTSIVYDKIGSLAASKGDDHLTKRETDPGVSEAARLAKIEPVGTAEGRVAFDAVYDTLAEEGL
jgi:hypothetical protein